MKHTPRKRFGQHFLHDAYVIQRIIDAIAVDEAVPIVEIGPGQGALTVPLLKAKGSLDVIEIDRDLAAYLAEACKEVGRLKIHTGDVLKFDISSLGQEPVKLVGNLPYNISTPLIFHLLEYLHCIAAGAIHSGMCIRIINGAFIVRIYPSFYGLGGVDFP